MILSTNPAQLSLHRQNTSITAHLDLAIHFSILFYDNIIFPYLLLWYGNDISPAIYNNPYLQCWWALGRKAMGDSAPTMGKYGIQLYNGSNAALICISVDKLSLIWKYFSGNSRRSLSPALLQIICKFRMDYLLLPWHKKPSDITSGERVVKLVSNLRGGFK